MDALGKGEGGLDSGDLRTYRRLKYASKLLQDLACRGGGKQPGGNRREYVKARRQKWLGEFDRQALVETCTRARLLNIPVKHPRRAKGQEKPSGAAGRGKRG